MFLCAVSKEISIWLFGLLTLSLERMTTCALQHREELQLRMSMTGDESHSFKSKHIKPSLRGPWWRVKLGLVCFDHSCVSVCLGWGGVLMYISISIFLCTFLMTIVVNLFMLQKLQFEGFIFSSEKDEG